jgi:hypothetical protein
MFLNTIGRFLLVLISLQNMPLISMPTPTPQKTPQVQNGAPRLNDQEKTPTDQRSSSSWNPLVYIGATIGALYVGGAIIAGAIYLRIKDLLPGVADDRNRPEDEE